MRSLRNSLLAVSAATLLAIPAFAQPPGGGGRGGMMQMGRMGAAQLIGNPGVQEELKFDDKLKEKVKEFVAKSREAMAGLRDLSPEERMEKMQEVMKTQTEAAEKFVKEHLSADQAKRLKQIVLQSAGMGAFAMEDVVKQLKLTDEQKEKIKGLGEDLRNDMRELRQGGGDPQDNMTKMRQLGKEYFGKAAATLTDEQKKVWAEMTGKPFEVKFERPRQDR